MHLWTCNRESFDTNIPTEVRGRDIHLSSSRTILNVRFKASVDAIHARSTSCEINQWWDRFSVRWRQSWAVWCIKFSKNSNILFRMMPKGHAEPRMHVLSTILKPPEPNKLRHSCKTIWITTGFANIDSIRDQFTRGNQFMRGVQFTRADQSRRFAERHWRVSLHDLKCSWASARRQDYTNAENNCPGRMLSGRIYLMAVIVLILEIYLGGVYEKNEVLAIIKISMIIRILFSNIGRYSQHSETKRWYHQSHRCLNLSFRHRALRWDPIQPSQTSRLMFSHWPWEPFVLS